MRRQQIRAGDYGYLRVDDLAEAVKGFLELALVRLPRQAAHEDPALLLPVHRRRTIRWVRCGGGEGEGRLGFGEKTGGCEGK